MIHANTFLPELSHVIDDGELPVFVTMNGRMGCLFEVPLLDLESREADNTISTVERFIEALPEGFTARLVQRAESSSNVGFESFRSHAMGQLGFVNRRILLAVECDSGDPLSLRNLFGKLRRRSARKSGADALLRSLPQHEIEQLGARALSREEIEREFKFPENQIVRRGNGVDSGNTISATVRIYKPGTRKIGEATLAGILDQLHAF